MLSQWRESVENNKIMIEFGLPYPNRKREKFVNGSSISQADMPGYSHLE